MADPFLASLIHGEEVKSKVSETVPLEDKNNRFAEEMRKEIAQQVKEIPIENDPSNQLLSVELKRARLEAEMLEALEMKDVNQQGEIAVAILAQEGKRYLAAGELENLKAQFLQASHHLAEDDINQLIDEDQIASGFNAEALAAIEKVAVAKFDEEQYSGSLALFVFLTLLDPGNANYWLRAGIASQRNGNETAALQYFVAATEIDPEMCEAHVFAADCYLNQKRNEDADKHHACAKQIFAAMDIKPQSLYELFETIEALITENRRAV